MNCQCGMEYKVGDISCVRCGNLDMTKDESLQAEREYMFDVVHDLRQANEKQHQQIIDLEQEIDRIRESLRREEDLRHQHDTCMCGVPMAAVYAHEGHMPVSAYDYHLECLISERNDYRDALERIVTKDLGEGGCKRIAREALEEQT